MKTALYLIVGAAAVYGLILLGRAQQQMTVNDDWYKKTFG